MNSNPRYKHFCQEFFTAGDEEQFQSTRDSTPNESGEFRYKPGDSETEIYHKFKNLGSAEIVTNTFRYIFHKFKKGIFIRIKDGKLVTFLPFSKSKFVNEWSDRIKIDPSTTLIDFMKHVNEMEGRPFNERRVNKYISGWYANNCLLRYEYPINEGDTGTHQIKAMFEELCFSCEVPDIELFINRRDFPLLKKDGTEPYNHIYNSSTFPLQSHLYEKYIPILSSTTADAFADIPIPTLEDWARVKSLEGVTYPKTSTRYFLNGKQGLPFSERKSTAVFRGSSTGAGVTIDSNPRLKVSYLSSLQPIDKDDGNLLLDAGITDWNLRPRKIQGEMYLKTIEISTLPFGLVPKLTPEEQMQFKYIVHIDGHVSAFRLSQELAMGSVLLIVDSPYRLWFRNLLKPWVHYVPVKSDLSDLLEQIKWCKTHEVECLKMTEECFEFYQTHLQKEGILRYLQNLLFDLAREFKYEYSKVTPFQRQIDVESKWLEEYSRNTPFLLFDKEIILAKTRLSTIKEMVHNSVAVVVKETTDPEKLLENKHEAFIGLNMINKAVADLIPNFVHILGYTETSSVVCEKVEGISLLNWLNSASFNFNDFINVLGQLALALAVAQLEIGFVHYDLFPWNVVLKKSSVPQTVSYPVTHGKVVEIQTTLMPVILDYGKSHVMTSRHFGFVNMFTFSSIQDILSIVLSSLSIILKRDERYPTSNIIKLVSFFSEKKFSLFSDVKNFVFNNSTFSSLVFSKNQDIAYKTPMDFVDFLTKEHQFKIIRTKSSFTSSAATSVIKQSFLDRVFDRAYVYYIFQKSRPTKRECLLEKLSDSSVKFKEIKINPLQWTFDLSNEFFQDKAKLKSLRKLAKAHSKETQKCVDYLDILHEILLYTGVFEITYTDRLFILKAYSNLLNRRLKIKEVNANLGSILA